MFHNKVAIFALCLVTRVVMCLRIYLTRLGFFLIILIVTLSCFFINLCAHQCPLYLCVLVLFSLFLQANVSFSLLL